MAPALIEMPEVNIDAAQFGDPLGKAGIRPAAPDGFGGSARAITAGSEWARDLGWKARARRASTVKMTRQPQLVYKEEPEYSDEARKAHSEGVVVLEVDVDVTGRPTNIRVLRGIGFGLDEKAKAAVARWKFRPAIAGDRPVVAPATIEVTFRLL